VNTAHAGIRGISSTPRKSGPAELAKIYSFDEALLTYVDKFKAAVDALAKAVGDKDTLPGAVSALETLGTEANEAYALRENVLTEIS